MVLVSKKHDSLLLVFLYIPVSIYRNCSSVLSAFVCTCGRNVREEYISRNSGEGINVCKNAEKTGERREEMRTTEGKKEKIVNLAYLAEQRISIF